MNDLQYDFSYIRNNIYSIVKSMPTGKGNFGSVFIISSRNNGIYYAIKKIEITENIKDIKRERIILSKIIIEI